MHEKVEMGVICLCLGGILLGAGLLLKLWPHILFSLLTIATGFYFLYKGIPLEIRERSYRRWRKLDEEERENSK